MIRTTTAVNITRTWVTTITITFTTIQLTIHMVQNLGRWQLSNPIW